MNGSEIIGIANYISDVIAEFYSPGNEGAIAQELAMAVPLDALENEGVEALLDVAANVSLLPQSIWMLNEEIKALNIPKIIDRRKAKEKQK